MELRHAQACAHQQEGRSWSEDMRNPPSGLRSSGIVFQLMTASMKEVSAYAAELPACL